MTELLVVEVEERDTLEEALVAGDALLIAPTVLVPEHDHPVRDLEAIPVHLEAAVDRVEVYRCVSAAVRSACRRLDALVRPG